MSFKDLGLKDALLRAVKEKGYTTPSPIQEKAIPHILEGKDILASAQTGTGKQQDLPCLFYNIYQKLNTQNTDPYVRWF